MVQQQKPKEWGMAEAFIFFAVGILILLFVQSLPGTNRAGLAAQTTSSIILAEGELLLNTPESFTLDGHDFTLAYTGFTRDGPIIKLNGTVLPQHRNPEGYLIMQDLYLHIIDFDAGATNYDIRHRWHAESCNGIDAGETSNGLCCDNELVEKPDCMLEIIHPPIQCGDYIIECHDGQLVNYEGTIPDSCPSPYQTCEEIDSCTGTWIDETTRCCDGSCVHYFPQPTCAEQGGSICPFANLCASRIPASDTNECCVGPCASPPIDPPTELEVAAPWTIKMSSTDEEVTLHFGEYGDTPVPGDYDGDGVTDLAVWRHYEKSEYRGPYSVWFIKQSSDDQVIEISWGNPLGDLPAQADYDGDGKTDIAVARAADDTWYIKLSSGGTRTEPFSPWPASDDQFFYDWRNEPDHWSQYPAPADYDGDGLADLAYFRPAVALWSIKRSSDNQVITFNYGRPGREYGMYFDFGTPGDFNGDGTDEAAVWRAEEEKWYVRGGSTTALGYALDSPAVGDYDGDGIDDFATFTRKPRFTSTYLASNLTNGHWGYDYQPSIMDDDGTIRMWWCGQSPTGKIDAVFYATSSSPTAGFTNIQTLDDGGCDATGIKLPGTMSNRCGGNPVYYVYYESDNHAYTYYPNGQVRTRIPYRDGNKILARWSCDAQNWHELGQVLGSTGYFAPQGTTIPYGRGHPNTVLVDGVLYMTYYYEAENTGGESRLAVSTDGEHFIDGEDVAVTVGGRVQYLNDADLFMGTTLTDLRKAPGLFFSKDLGRIENFIPNKQYFDSADLSRLTESPMECHWGGRPMTKPDGTIDGETVYFFGAEWDTGQANICEHWLDPDFSLGTSEIYTMRIDLDLEESNCLGSSYRGCANGVQERQCTATGWDAWESCVQDEIPTCAEQGGTICGAEQSCPTAWLPASDNPRCCPTTCETRPSEIQGFVDNLDENSIQGWAYDNNNPTRSVTVSVFDNSEQIYSAPTTVERPDVNAAFGITGTHGYHIPISLTTGTHTIRVEAEGEVLTEQTLQVVRVNDANITAIRMPSSMQPGQTYTIEIDVKNTGTTTWTKAGAYKVGIPSVSTSVWGIGRLELSPTDSVAPGQTHTFQLQTIAPNTPGPVTLQVQMVQEMVEWFGEKSAIARSTVSGAIQTMHVDVWEYVSGAPSFSLCFPGGELCQQGLGTVGNAASYVRDDELHVTFYKDAARGNIGVIKDGTPTDMRCFSGKSGDCNYRPGIPNMPVSADLPILPAAAISPQRATQGVPYHVSLQPVWVNPLDATTCAVKSGGSSIIFSSKTFIIDKYDFGGDIGMRTNVLVTELPQGYPTGTTNPDNAIRFERYFFVKELGMPAMEEGWEDPDCRDSMSLATCNGEYTRAGPGQAYWNTYGTAITDSVPCANFG